MDKIEELHRIDSGDCEMPYIVIDHKIHVICDDEPATVLARTKEVLKLVIGSELSPSDPPEDWRAVLPQWFVEKCCEEEDPVLEIANQGSDEVDTSRESPEWSVGAFVYWFTPEERPWYWWCSEIVDERSFDITLLGYDWLIAWGALKWLLIVAGAKECELVE